MIALTSRQMTSLQRCRFLSALGALLFVGCATAGGSAEHETTPEVEPRQPPPLVDANGSGMGVSGIQSSMAVADAREAMRPRMEAIFACFAPRAARFEALGGRMRMLIRVQGSGRVLAAIPEGSTVGDRDVERCVSDVVMDTPFPQTSGGGEVELRWSFVVEPSRASAEPVLWDPSRVDRVVRRRGPRTRTACDIQGSVEVTAYVRRGRVVSAGATSIELDDDALDCVADHVSRWRGMPSSRRTSKVTFALR